MIEPIEKAQKTWVLALTSVASLMPARKPMKAAATLDEGAIDLVGLRCQNAVQSNGVGHGCFSQAYAATTQRIATLCFALRALNARAFGPGPFLIKYTSEVRRIGDKLPHEHQFILRAVERH